MQFIGSVWRFALPLVAIATGALVLVAAVRAGGEWSPISRPYGWILALVWLSLVGEAALGEQRPVFERQWKGAAALLLGLGAAIHLYKRYRWRRNATPQPAPHRKKQTTLAAVTVVVTMPGLGEHVVEGTVTRWLKRVGDTVEAGEPLFEVSTDKVDAEIPAEASGTLREIKVAAGRTAPVGAAIAAIGPSAGTSGGSRRSI